MLSTCLCVQNQNAAYRLYIILLAVRIQNCKFQKTNCMDDFMHIYLGGGGGG